MPQPTTASPDVSTQQAHHIGVMDAARLAAGLRGSLAHHERIEGKQLSPLIAALSTWQSNRLARTYADLLADPAFSQGCHFFLEDIYAARDFSQRDHDGQRIYQFMNRFLPEAALAPLALALELSLLTQELDMALAEAMSDHLGVTDRFTQADYEEGYRLCDNYDARVRQIELIVEEGRHLERVRRLPFISTTLRVARGPAERLGWHEMQNFLERGYEAWKSMKDSGAFIAAIKRRELAILNRIYGKAGGAPEANPFLVTDGASPLIQL